MLSSAYLAYALPSKIAAFFVHTSQSHPPRSFGRGRFPPQGPICPSPRSFSRSITSSHVSTSMRCTPAPPRSRISAVPPAHAYSSGTPF